MKHVVGVSLGSSQRNSKSETCILGEKFIIERIGTDGDKKCLADLLRSLDGTVDAFGLGGTDRYLWSANRRYTLKEADRLAKNAVKTPIADGSGIKNTLERKMIEYLQVNDIIDFKTSNVMLVSAVDRFGMAQALTKFTNNLIIGDLMFVLNIPIPIRSYKVLSILADIFLPIICLLPLSLIYPTGKKQEKTKPKYEKYYAWADVICGDFLLIRKTLPPSLKNKTIITNTVTAADTAILRERGLKMLVTTTPEFNGRCYATNVFEAVMLTLMGKSAEDAVAEDYMQLLKKMDWKPTVTHFDAKGE